MRSTRFLGCQYPLVKTSRGLLAQKSDVDQIKADILQLLLTNPGERVMNPGFGVPLNQLVFEPNDASLALQAQKMIQDAIAKYEPRVVINSISVSNVDDTVNMDNALLISIEFYDPDNIKVINALTLEIPVTGS